MAVVVVAVVVVVAKERFVAKAIDKHTVEITVQRLILRMAVRTNLVEFFSRIANFIPFYLF